MQRISFALFTIALLVIADITARVVVAHADADTTAVVADREHGVIRIMIGGREAARFTGNGLEVRDNIAYGGSIVDTGPADFDRESSDTHAP